MLDFDIQKIERKNLTDQVVAALRVMMFSGQVPAGRRLIETDLANKLGVGRGSLREALRKLEGEGLVESIPGRGTYIASLSERDIQEVFSLRLVLETAAISLAIKNATPEQFEKLQETLDIMMETARLGDAVAVVELDLKFHRQIWEMADHQRMKNVLEGLLSQLRIYLAVFVHLQDYMVAGINDHLAILDALKRRDLAAAVTSIEVHLKDADTLIVESLRERSWFVDGQSDSVQK